MSRMLRLYNWMRNTLDPRPHTPIRIVDENSAILEQTYQIAYTEYIAAQNIQNASTLSFLRIG